MSDFRMPDLNHVQIAGRLTRDPELRYLPSGMAVCKMGLAVSRFYKTKDGEKKEETLFINVTTWGKSAEYCNEYMKKGHALMVSGSLRSNDFEDKQGQKRSVIEITGERVQAMEWHGSKAADGGKQSSAARQADAAPIDDDIPF